MEFLKIKFYSSFVINIFLSKSIQISIVCLFDNFERRINIGAKRKSIFHIVEKM